MSLVEPVGSIVVAQVASTASDASSAPEVSPQQIARARAPGLEPVRALRATPVPDLLADWKAATVAQCIWDTAYATFGHEVDAAVDALITRLGRDLSDAEYEAIAAPIIESHMPRPAEQSPLYRRTQLLIAGTPAQRAKLVDDTVKDLRAFIDAKKVDPFTRIARKVRGARDNERVLWENANLMVLVDIKAKGPHLLVIPKAQTMFPSDASRQLLAELARAGAIAADALMAAASSSTPAHVWVNAPQALHVKQLHVHVSAKLPNWDQSHPDKARRAAAEATLWDSVRQRLATRLGPST